MRRNVETFIASLRPDRSSCPCPRKEELPACRSHHPPALNTQRSADSQAVKRCVLSGEPTALGATNGLRAKNSLEKLIRKPLLSAFHHAAERAASLARAEDTAAEKL